MAFDAKVARVPVLPQQKAIRNGTAIRSGTWSACGELYQYLNAQGRQAVAAHTPNIEIPNSSTYTFSYMYNQSPIATARAWMIKFKVSFTAETSKAVPYQINSSLNGIATNTSLSTPIMFLETFTQGASANQEITLDIENLDSANALRVMQIACFELPRASLDLDTTDEGIDTGSLGVGSPITALINNQSMESLRDVWPNLQTDLTRGSMFAFSRSENTGATFTTLADVYNVYPMILGRHLNTGSGGDQETVTVAAQCSTGAGTTGRVYFTPESDDPDGQVSISFAAGQDRVWQTTTMEVNTTDFSTADGRRDSIWEEIQIEAERTAGSNAFTVHATAIYE